MSAEIIDGKKVSANLRTSLKQKVQMLKSRGISPGLAVILVGEDPASQTYVKNKAKACDELGVLSRQYNLAENTTQQELCSLIEKLNSDNEIHGILVQLPLPSHIDENLVISTISPAKDVDAFTRENVGSIMIGDYKMLPCTPAGVMELIKSTGVDISGKNCVVIGRSNIVGKPMAMLMLHANATVTICHSRTADLKSHCLNADILISAVGIANFVTADMIKPGAVVIDVGMNRNDKGKLCGDVDFEQAKKIARYITPVPGGVGPMTITMLMANTITAAEI